MWLLATLRKYLEPREIFPVVEAHVIIVKEHMEDPPPDRWLGVYVKMILAVAGRNLCGSTLSVFGWMR